MRPAFVAVLFIIIGLILIVFSLQKEPGNEQPNPIASKTRRRTGTIFFLVAAGLLLLDLLTQTG